ncbi:post-GPI attachment to proteins factor 3-like [Mercenaria mercenaria]|uniref:post-GPI attachment to proteins factor 3-like n=1 Tax=Mercenaria mercenaria TaxID=6596 RepID=UPI00234F0AFF|nr:post-GPI attachment to proteins factor 3-like [Mercenaria mercenaria]XP_053373560.1 post-GPI attachment to proteins factor 3-like [Mercenaria mercenaria]
MEFRQMPLSVRVVLLLLGAVVTMVTASVGDRSYVYQKCNHHCKDVNCTGTQLKTFKEEQPFSHQLLKWSCEDECKYMCMWITVDAFQKDGLKVPQFHGKWPFVRLYGIQEPASMIFSVFNGLAHLCIFYYRKLIPSSTPMYYVWHGAAITAMFAWTCSTIFHCKDTDFTEKMDYFCAFSIVLYNTFTLACRVLGTVKWYRPALIGLGCVAFFIQHVCYLTFNKFDYGYNMQVNIGVAVCNMIGWTAWCFMMRRNKYVWKAIASIVGIQLLLCLELGDFPPLYWALDAHSLWHAGTWPLALLWYSFIIDDAKLLGKTRPDRVLPSKID